MRILSGLLSMIGLGALTERNAKPFVGSAQVSAAKLREDTHVYRGGRHHTRNTLQCPGCGTSTAKIGQCLNRGCKSFNGRLAKTNPDLLSLDRNVRMRALDRWAHAA